MLYSAYSKNINETHDHDMGNKVLNVMVAKLYNNLRMSDMVFRTGGEECTVLLRGFRSPSAC